MLHRIMRLEAALDLINAYVSFLAADMKGKAMSGLIVSHILFAGFIFVVVSLIWQSISSQDQVVSGLEKCNATF